MPEILAVDALCRSYGAVRALDGVSFRIDRPSAVGVLGPNGAGKTTLFEIIEGLARPDAGEVRLFGEALARRYPRRRVGVVLQRESFLEGMTVREYADLFATIHRARDGVHRILREARLTERGDVPVERLSGGEAQRLYIAAACVHEPEVLILDEPTAHLDPAVKRDLGQWIRAMADRRVVLISTHDLHEAEVVCDRAILMVKGKVKAQGTIAELLDAVPPAARRGRGLEDAFFYFCGLRIGAEGDSEAV